MATESADELRSKLSTYQEQLAQIDTLINTDPQNKAFQKLRSDILQVISITNDLLKLKEPQQASSTSDRPDSGTPNVEAGSGGAVAAATTTAAGETPGAGVSGSAPAPPQAPSVAEAAPVSLEKTARRWKEGDRVEVKQGEIWYPGVVSRVVSGGAEGGAEATTVAVTYIGFGNTQVVESDVVRALQPPPGGMLPTSKRTPGTLCMAKYLADGRWYAAKIEDAPAPDGSIRVLFTAYGDIQVVPPEYIKARVARAATGGAPAGATAAATGGAGAGAAAAGAKAGKSKDGLKEIPESLQILPTDTEEEKARKRKKIKIIKNQNRFKKKDMETNSKKATWQNFVAKSQKKKKKGMSGGVVRKRSMFATPDGVDGKVGVIGSGRGMTEFDESLRSSALQVKRMRKGD